MQTISDTTAPAEERGELTAVEGELHLKRLMRALSIGEVAALSNLYSLTAGQVFGIAYFKLRSREDAEEIVVDVYHHVWQHAVAYDAKRGSVRTWLAVMTRNRAIDRLRRRRVGVFLSDQQRENLLLSLMGTAAGPEQILSHLEANSALHRGILCLNSNRRALLRLAFFEGLTHEEIAAAVGMPLGTVKSHVRRALAALQQHLQAEA